MAFSPQFHGSACGPVIVPVFKTGGRQAILSPVGSTPTRFRHFYVFVINNLDCLSLICAGFVLRFGLRAFASRAA
jgi:hypothetical protein